MKQKSTQEQKYKFQDEVDRLLLQLKSLQPESEEYAKTVKQLEVLCTARSHRGSDNISMDTILMVGANLLGILLILNFERANIMTSKAINFVLKGKS
jgi:hypothetical protein